MTILYDANRPGASTHAIVIGVGMYRHLPGGPGPTMADPMGLTQLTSPPISAEAFCRWLLTDLNNPGASLGTVELLLSPASGFQTPDGRVVQVEAATRQNIQRAFRDWYARCDADDANVALFYFCGHGIAKASLALLAEDFGEDDLRLFGNAFDFEMTHRAMARCRARVQCYFVDACRQVPWAVLELLEPDAGVLIDPRVRQPRRREAPIFYASAPDSRAYARPGEITLFTEALLTGLRGLGAKREAGKWVVTSTRLGEAVCRTVQRLAAGPGAPDQECRLEGQNTGNSIIHVLAGPPDVPVTVGCEPPEATAHAALALKSTRDPACRYSRPPEPGDWVLPSVRAGGYDVRATFADGAYRDYEDECLVMPPCADERLLVAP